MKLKSFASWNCVQMQMQIEIILECILKLLAIPHLA